MIDQLVVLTRQAPEGTEFNQAQDLARLRARQREIIEQLHASEKKDDNVWENIGNGG